MHGLPHYFGGFGRCRTGEGGSTLLYAIGAILLLAAAGAAIVSMTSSSTLTKLEQQAGEKAFYNAQSGLNYILSMQRAYEANNSNFNTFLNAMGGNNTLMTYNLPGNGQFTYNLVSNGSNGFNITYLLGVDKGSGSTARSSYLLYGGSSGNVVQYNPVKSGDPPAIAANTADMSGNYIGTVIANTVLVHGGSTLKGNINSLSTTNALTLAGGVTWSGDSLCSNDGMSITGASVITGDINSHGAVSIVSSTVNGNIYATGNVTIDGGSTINGNIYTNGSVALNNGTINGDVYLNGSFSKASWVTYTGHIYANTKSPADCSTITMPAHETPTSGTVLNVSGDYTFTGVTDINSHAYKFKSITVSGGSRLCFDLSTANSYINLFVMNNIDIGGGVGFYVKTKAGNCFSASNLVSDLTFAKADYASRVYMDVGGTVTIGGGSNWFGTTYAVGNIYPGGGISVIGGLYSSGGMVNPYDTWYNFKAVSSDYFSSRLK